MDRAAAGESDGERLVVARVERRLELIEHLLVAAVRRESGSSGDLVGVREVVRVGEDAVAVVADTWWQAKTALDALPVTWERGGNADVSSASIEAMLDEGLDAYDALVGNSNGDAQAAIANAAKTVEATYGYPYQNHATMEPMNATALWTTQRCEVWCPTQNGEAALTAAAEAAGLPASQCEVYKIHLGGGFGRRGAFHDFVTQAVTIAKQLPGTPVKLLWTREEDMQHGHYHPVTQCRLTGGLDEQGELTGLHVRISGQSILAAVNPAWMTNGMDTFTFQGMLPDGDHAFSYTVPNLLVEHAMRNPPVPPGFWRGVNINQNAIYMECFMDELAHAAGADPLLMRLVNHGTDLGKGEIPAQGTGIKTGRPYIHCIRTLFQGGFKSGKVPCRGKYLHAVLFFFHCIVH